MNKGSFVIVTAIIASPDKEVSVVSLQGHQTVKSQTDGEWSEDLEGDPIFGDFRGWFGSRPASASDEEAQLLMMCCPTVSPGLIHTGKKNMSHVVELYCSIMTMDAVLVHNGWLGKL